MPEPISELNVESLKKDYQEILENLGDPELISDWEKFEEMKRKKNYLEKIIEKDKELREIKNKIEENKSIISAGEEPELTSLAEVELIQFKKRERVLKKELNDLLSKNRANEEVRSAIIEIRAGTGGKEATLFTSDLFRMYSKYAQNQGWKQKILDSRPTELGGFKEIIFELSGSNVFSKMKYEGGVHRVQRIPETEKSGRIHTSTISVAVLPKPKKAEIKIKPDELRIDFYRASGPGGQYVNKRETAVRITHLPTGIVATSQNERNQLQNKENAITILEVKLLEKKETEEAEKLSEKRKSQIKRAKRAEKIRTYNFPQDRVTDHRIKKNFHHIEGIMSGRLNPIIEALLKKEDY